MVEQCGTVWWDSVEQYGETVQQCGGTVWNSVVEQCGTVWWNSVVEQCGTVWTSVVHKWNSVK